MRPGETSVWWASTFATSMQTSTCSAGTVTELLTSAAVLTRTAAALFCLQETNQHNENDPH